MAMNVPEQATTDHNKISVEPGTKNTSDRLLAGSKVITARHGHATDRGCGDRASATYFRKMRV